MVEAVLLGTAQDAGLPQIGCTCRRCAAARSDGKRRRHPASLAVIDHQKKCFWLVDVTPAISTQCEFVFARYPEYALSGVLLTHAHIGHYTGLIQFGKEAWNTRALPVWASAWMISFLQKNEPWASIARENLALQRITPGEAFALGGALMTDAIEVTHRAEHTDTLAFRFRGARGALLYCPDIDRWGDPELEQMIHDSGDALLDGTFYAGDELPGRDLAEIPHPLVTNTVRHFAHTDCRIWLVHLNHSNPLHDDGEALAWVRAHGMDVAEQWQSWQLG